MKKRKKEILKNFGYSFFTKKCQENLTSSTEFLETKILLFFTRLENVAWDSQTKTLL